MNIDYSPGNAYLKPLSGELFVFVHDFCTTFDDILTMVCNSLFLEEKADIDDVV